MKSVVQASGKQPLRMYIERRQAMVAEWVSTWSIFEVYAQEEMGYSGWGSQRAPW